MAVSLTSREVFQKRYGFKTIGLDVIISNAGIIGNKMPMNKLKVVDIQEILDVNLLGPFALIKEALPHLEKSGGGNVVFITSIAGKVQRQWSLVMN